MGFRRQSSKAKNTTKVSRRRIVLTDDIDNLNGRFEHKKPLRTEGFSSEPEDFSSFGFLPSASILEVKYSFTSPYTFDKLGGRWA